MVRKTLPLSKNRLHQRVKSAGSPLREGKLLP